MAKQPNKSIREPIAPPSSQVQEPENPTVSLEDTFSFLKSRIDNLQTNPYVEAAPHSFNPESTKDLNQNFEHFYSHSSYNRLGWNPWRNNESLYNEKGSKTGDVARAIKSGLKLMGTGFISPLRSYSDVFSGSPLSPDFESGREMAYHSAVGSSTRGGVTGFTSNLITSAGYTAGVMAEILGETLALSYLTGGVGGVGRLMKVGKDLGKLSTAVQGINKTMTAFKDYGVAKAAWQATKGVAKFVNPLEHTTETIYGIATGVKKFESLNALAKASKTAGSFFRDITTINASLSEAKMEGAMAQQDLERELIEKYRADHNGLQPSQHELVQIKNAAADAGQHTLAWNIPTIFLTNKITFDPLFKSFAKPSEFAIIGGRKMIQNKAGEFVESTFKNRFKNALKPKNLALAPLTYFKENFSEGLQETLQEVISGTAKDYYRGLYNSTAYRGLQYGIGENITTDVMGDFSKNVVDQFSGKGFEVFASGFLMGGLGKVISVPFNAIRQEVKDYKRQRSEYEKATIKTLNELNKNPLNVFGARILNFAASGQAIANQAVAQQVGDAKEWHDNETHNLTSQAMTALETNTYDIMLDKLRSIKTMEPQAIKDAYGVDGQEVLSKIDKIITRAEKVKDNYEKWSARYENPYSPRMYKADTPEFKKEALAWSAWEHAKKIAIFNDTSFQRNLERIQSIHNNILQTGSLSKLHGNDVSLLFSPTTITNEINLLNNEVEIAESSLSPEIRKSAAYKKSKKKTLERLHSKLLSYYAHQNLDSADKDLKAALGDIKKTSVESLEKVFQDYMKVISTNQTNTVHVNDMDLGVAFKNLLDLHELKQDNIYYAQAINTLADPDSFLEQKNRLNQVFSDLYENREDIAKKAVEDAQSKIEDNTILSVLHTRGFVLSSENAELLLKKKQTPTQFFDINAKQVVDNRDKERFAEFESIIKNYKDATTPEPVVEVKPVVSVAPVTTTATAAAKPVVKTSTVKNPAIEADIPGQYAAIKTGEDLEKFTENMRVLMAQTTIDQRDEANISSKIIDNMIRAKEQELAVNITLAQLNVNDIVSMTDPKQGNMIIVKKTKDSIVLEQVGDRSTKITVKEDNLKKSIKYKYSAEVTPNAVVITPQQTQNTQVNIAKNIKLTDDKDRVTEIVTQAFANEKEFEEEFLENIGCK